MDYLKIPSHYIIDLTQNELWDGDKLSQIVQDWLRDHAPGTETSYGQKRLMGQNWNVYVSIRFAKKSHCMAFIKEFG